WRGAESEGGDADGAGGLGEGDLKRVPKPRGRQRITRIRIKPKISWERPAALAENQSFMSSSSGMIKNAPRIGPAGVPMPPRMAISATRIEIDPALKTVSGSKNTATCA